MELLSHIQTVGTFGYFHKSCMPFFLRNPFTKELTFQDAVLTDAEYFQESAQDPSQSDLGSKVFFGIGSPSKRCLMFREVNPSAAKPLLHFLLIALCSFCSMLAPAELISHFVRNFTTLLSGVNFASRTACLCPFALRKPQGSSIS